MNRWLRLALEISRSSQAPKHQLAAVIVLGGAVQSVAVNFQRETHDRDYRGKCAEARAIRPHRDYRGADIYVVRSNLRCSRPCDSCQAKIAAAGIRRAVFVDWNGNVASERYC